MSLVCLQKILAMKYYNHQYFFYLVIPLFFLDIVHVLSFCHPNSMSIHVHCSRAMGDSISAVSNYEESAEILSKLPTKDLEVLILLL